jgi:hypothetical protein
VTADDLPGGSQARGCYVIVTYISTTRHQRRTADTSDAVAAEVLNAPARPRARAAEPSRTAIGNMNMPAPRG